MTKRAVPFREADVKRACKGVMAAGLVPKRAEIGMDGKIVVIFSEGVADDGPANSLDRWLEAQSAKTD